MSCLHAPTRCTYCGLAGSVPASWGNLKYLSIFSLTGNSLTPGATLMYSETVIVSRMYSSHVYSSC